jgi:micrococcal nuclease
MPRRRYAALFVLLASLVVPAVRDPTAAVAASTPPKGVPAGAQEARVWGWIDGAAFKVRDNGKTETLQLIGVDAPNLATDTSGEECYATEARDHLRTLLAKKQTVYLERDQRDRDAAGSVLCYAWVVDPTTTKAYLLNSKVVRDGYAAYADMNPNARYDANIKKAESDARAKRRGLWTACGGAHVLLSAVVAPTSVPTAEPTEQPTASAPQGFSADEQAYLDRILPDIETMTQSLNRFSDLMANPLPGVDTWTFGVAAELATWRVTDEDVHAITPPPVFATMHDLFTQAMDLYVSASFDIATGIDALDASLLASANDKLNQATDLVTQATQELDNIKQQRGITQ